MNGSDAEREILARLRGLSRNQSARAVRDDLETLATPASAPLPEADLTDAFLANLRRNGATAATAANREDAIAALANYIAARQSQRRFVAGHDPRLAALPWRVGGLLPRFGVAGAGDRVVVSYAQCGIAETGSVCLWANRDNPALNSLLCEHHVVLLDRADLHRNLETVWSEAALRDAGSRPRGLMMISGPSSTADIAMKLVLGAHGPRALHVIVVGGGQSGL